MIFLFVLFCLVFSICGILDQLCLRLTFSPYSFLNLKESQQFYINHEFLLEDFDTRRSDTLVLGVLCLCIWPWLEHWAVFTAYVYLCLQKDAWNFTYEKISKYVYVCVSFTVEGSSFRLNFYQAPFLWDLPTFFCFLCHWIPLCSYLVWYLSLYLSWTNLNICPINFGSYI